MKRFVILILFAAVLTTGCSYEITAENSQRLQGENEYWKADYSIDFKTIYPREGAEISIRKMERKNIIVTYKKHLSDLSEVKHLEISYQDSFGGGGYLAEDFDSPPIEKQFRLGSGGSSTESGGFLMNSENLPKSFMIFSGPGYEMRTNATATVTIKVDGKTDTIQLAPAEDSPPMLTLFEQIDNKMSKPPFLRFFSGSASDMSLKLESYDVRIVTDKTISGSIEVTEGERKGQELVPTVLYYEFILRNEGRKTILGNLNDLEVKIVPGDHLKEVSKETVGVDIFDPDSGPGFGQSLSDDIFKINNDCELTLSIDLSKESPEGTLITPGEEELKKLLDSASDASLIILYKDEEAANLDLYKY